MKKSAKIIIVFIAGIALMQLFRPKEVFSYVEAADLQGVPHQINAILQNACYDCHSYSTNLRFYDKITPVNFMVASDIIKGRKALNFSKWDSLATPQQNSLLYYALNKVLAGEMPLPAYTVVYPSAKVNDGEINILKNYLLSRTPRKPKDSAQTVSVNKQYVQWTESNHSINNKVALSPNGIAFIPGYRNWKAISTTDRFDNGTMRIIFANDIAVEAIKNHQISPWPNGSILAKTAWKQQPGEDGNVSTGEFIQVEFMIKDSEKYKASEGWGWARWKGFDLKPYGKVDVKQECISCHSPVKKNENVFTSPFNLGAAVSGFKINVSGGEWQCHHE